MKSLALCFGWLILATSSLAQVVPGNPAGGGPTSTIVGQIQTATSGSINNGTLTFTLSQPSIVVGTALVSPQTSACYTSVQGNIVGLPDPLVPPSLSGNVLTGTLPGGTYYVKFYYYNAFGSVSAVSPEAVLILSGQGSLIVAPPLLQPSSAQGIGVAIGTSPGTETVQGNTNGFVQYQQATSLVAGPIPQPVNNSSCGLYFSDQLIPTGTYYTVNFVNKNGSQVAGFPQTWCTYGGAGGTINVSQGAPTGNCNTNGVFYPTPIFANSPSPQSVTGPMTFAGSETFTGSNTFSGANTFNGNNSFTGATSFSSVANINGTLYVDGVTYTTIEAAIAALPSGGGKVRTADGFSETFTSQIDVGTATKRIALEIGANSTLTCGVTGGAGKSCLVIHDGSSIRGNGISSGVSRILTSAVNVDQVITCGECSTSAQEYFALENIAIQVDAAASTINKAVLYLQGMFVPSYIRDVTIFNFANTKGFWLDSPNLGPGSDIFKIDNLWVNGSNNTGAFPCLFSVSTGSAQKITGITVIGGGCEHSDATLPTLSINGNGLFTQLFGINFYDFQVEPNAAQSANPLLIEDARGINFFGGTFKGFTAPYAIDIEQSVGNAVDSVRIDNVTCFTGATGCLTNGITSRTFTSAGSTFSYFYSLGGVTQTGSPIFDSGMTVNSATLRLPVVASGSAPVITGTGACVTGSLANQTGTWSGSIKCGGTTGASTLVIAPGPTAANGFFCSGSDYTSGHELAGAQSGLSTSTCTLKFTSVTSADFVSFTVSQF